MISRPIKCTKAKIHQQFENMHEALSQQAIQVFCLASLSVSKMEISAICPLHVQIVHILIEHIGRLARMSVLDTEVDGSNPGSSMLFP